MKKLVSKFLLLSIFVFTSKSLGLFKDLFLVDYYSFTHVLDEYYYSFNIVSIFNGSLFSVITLSVTPILISLNDDISSSKLNGQLNAIVLCMTGFFFLIFNIVVFVSDSINPFWHTLSPIIILSPLTSLIAVRFISSETHINSLMEGIPPLVVVLSTCFLKISLYASTALGFFLYFIISYLPVRKNYHFNFQFNKKLFAEVKQASFAIIVIMLLTDAIKIFDIHILSFIDEGSVVKFTLSEKISGIFISIGSLVLGRTLLPHFAKSNSSKKAFFGIAKWSAVTFLIVLCLIFILQKLNLEKLLLKLGQDTLIPLLPLVRVSLLKIPIYISSLILSYWLLAKGKTKIVFLATCIFFLLKVVPTLALYFNGMLDVEYVIILSVFGYFTLYVSLLLTSAYEYKKNYSA